MHPDATQPRILATSANDATVSGAAWKLAEPGRGLDANLIQLHPCDGIAMHEGPDLDVLIHVAGGSGTVDTDAGDLEVTVGDIVWLPKGSVRGFTAGPNGLRYLTVHTRKPGMQIGKRPE